jgi:hypothetical protein
MNWFQDSDGALDYVRSRARVYMSGHEHNPSVKIEPFEAGCDLMRLAAGATVPPKVEHGVNYCYNVVEFEWAADIDALSVTVTPRAWVKSHTRFGDAPQVLAGLGPTFQLGCPNFRRGVNVQAGETPEPTSAFQEVATAQPKRMEAIVEDRYQGLLLRFFRDLTQSQRLSILVDLVLLPPQWSGPVTHVLERRCLDRLQVAGDLDKLERAIDQFSKKTQRRTRP